VLGGALQAEQYLQLPSNRLGLLGLPLGLPGATYDYRNPGDNGYLCWLGLLGLPLGLPGASSDYRNPGDIGYLCWLGLLGLPFGSSY
jgi:hypothetical protein